MAISRNNSVLHSDINAIFSAFNTLINSQTWGINAIPAADIPSQGSKVDDANIAVLNAKIDEFNSNEYLSTKDWWVKSTVTEGDLLRATDLTNIINSVSHMSSVVCKNKADNNYGTRINCCDSRTCNQSGHGYSNKSNNCNQGGHRYGNNGNRCNQGGHRYGNNGNRCNQGGHRYGNNGNRCNQGGHRYGTTNIQNFACGLLCQFNYHNCVNTYLYPLRSGGRCGFAGYSVSGYLCCWCNTEAAAAGHQVFYCNPQNAYGQWTATLDNCTYACGSQTCGSQTCSYGACSSQTCSSQTCTYGACTSQTCSSQTCTYGACTSQTCSSQTCSYQACTSQTCTSQTCANTSDCVHGGCSAHTQTIDITCNHASNTYD